MPEQARRGRLQIATVKPRVTLRHDTEWDYSGQVRMQDLWFTNYLTLGYEVIEPLHDTAWGRGGRVRRGERVIELNLFLVEEEHSDATALSPSEEDTSDDHAHDA